MIPHGVEVFVAVEPIDMCLGFDRLAGLAQERMQRSARCGALFLFFGKRRTALNVCSSMGHGSACCINAWTNECSSFPNPSMARAS